jgi:methionyl-tRNA formyltransferase
MRILFWGTPEFATPPLRALIGEGHEVVGVVTQPDRPRGRSRSTLDPSPVKLVALEEEIPVLQPDRPRGDAFLAAIGALEPEISVVVAYGHIIPKAVIDLPRLGTLNIHASLLPAYRGAAPIEQAVRDGLTESGVTIMRMQPALDSGPVILALKTPIGDDETGGELRLRLSELGAEAIVQALALISLGMATETPQDDTLATYARKIDREHARIDWTASCATVANLVRAYDPKPGAWTALGPLEVRCFGARVEPALGGAPRTLPGTLIDVSDDGLLIACGSGAVRLTDVHPGGKKRLAAAQWVRGRGMNVGDRFG